ncbi:MAG: hypothetical protein NTU91_00965 [Chloroflexi bacterium]|nr:hypothetical protein [Chloroflexota bacterium]
MTSFFKAGSSSDRHYTALRDGAAPIVADGRAFVEMLWTGCSQFLDDGLRQRAPDAYMSTFWELYLAYTLDIHGVGLVPRAQRQPAGHGPDLLARQPRVWIEAVAPGPGEGLDAVREPPNGVAFSVPDDQIILRLRSAIEEKRRRALAYRERGWIAHTDPFVVALNAARIPSAMLEITIPRVVRCVLPFGHEQLVIDRATVEVVDRFFSYRREVLKQSGQPVATDLFLDPAYSPISALLYSCSDEINRPPCAGPDFIFVHNPLASGPVPRGWLPFGWEYWVEGDRLHRREHGPGGIGPGGEADAATQGRSP